MLVAWFAVKLACCRSGSISFLCASCFEGGCFDCGCVMWLTQAWEIREQAASIERVLPPSIPWCALGRLTCKIYVSLVVLLVMNAQRRFRLKGGPSRAGGQARI